MLLALAAVTGVVLAVHGWSGRHSGLAPGALSGPARSSSSAGPASGSRPTAGPGNSGASQGAKVGPLLSSQSFAQYAYLVWPGTPDAAARTAMTGLSISVHRAGGGISVAAGVDGRAAAAPHVYRSGAKVYVVEASLGDDSGSSDYNLGDDGLVVTDARGRIVQ